MIIRSLKSFVNKLVGSVLCVFCSVISVSQCSIMPKVRGKITLKRKAKEMITRRWSTNHAEETSTCEMEASNSKGSNEPEHEDEHQYMFVDVTFLRSLYKNALCCKCFKESVTAQIRNTFGFSRKVVVKCENCGYVLNEIYTCSQKQKSQNNKSMFDINKKVVESFNRFGRGYAALEIFCLGMDMNIMSKYTYYNILNHIVRDGKVFANHVLEESRRQVREAHIKENGVP